MKRRSWRCMTRLKRGSERRGYTGRKCWTRVTKHPHELAECPRCGKDTNWADVTQDVQRTRRRQLCRCSGYAFSHTIYSRDCENNPFRDAMGDVGRQETGDDPSW